MVQDNNELFSKLRGELPQIFSKGAFPPIQISLNGVTIVIDPLFQVSSVKLQGVPLDPAQLSRLEESLLKAINQANQEVARRALARLTQSIGDGTLAPVREKRTRQHR